MNALPVHYTHYWMLKCCSTITSNGTLPSHCLSHTRTSPPPHCFTALVLQATWRQKTVWLRLLSGWSNHLLGWIHVCVSSKVNHGSTPARGVVCLPSQNIHGGKFQQSILAALRMKIHSSPKPSPTVLKCINDSWQLNEQPGYASSFSFLFFKISFQFEFFLFCL